MKLENGQRFVFIGDSVTDMGRTRNAEGISEGLFEPLGKGYPHVFSGLVAAAYPQLNKLRLTNVGNSGNTIRDLKARWQKDVLDLNPDWLSIMIGINDVWRQFDSPQLPETHVLPDEYEATLDELTAKTLPALKGGMIIMTPYYLETNRQDAMRARMDEYGAICKKIAEKYGTFFIDTQAAFDHFFQYQHSSFVAWDRVHPNIYGATILAREMLKVLDFDFYA